MRLYDQLQGHARFLQRLGAATTLIEASEPWLTRYVEYRQSLVLYLAKLLWTSHVRAGRDPVEI